jgi:hypothetical protein
MNYLFLALGALCWSALYILYLLGCVAVWLLAMAWHMRARKFERSPISTYLLLGGDPEYEYDEWYWKSARDIARDRRTPVKDRYIGLY